eukprot:3041727-Alexandrium_andersonii.AAC.1
MFVMRIRTCSDPTVRPLGDHIGSELERHRVWQNNFDLEYMAQRSIFCHDSIDFSDAAAYDFARQPERTLDGFASVVEEHEPVRQRDGNQGLLPHQYVPLALWPRFPPKQVITLRRSNCRASFSQIA